MSFPIPYNIYGVSDIRAFRKQMSGMVLKTPTKKAQLATPPSAPSRTSSSKRKKDFVNLFSDDDEVQSSPTAPYVSFSFCLYTRQ